MELLGSVIQQILNIGAVALLPVIITILGIVFKMNFFKALKSGLLIGVGFQGLKLIIGLLNTTLMPITTYYQTTASAYSFTTVDVGWQTLSAGAWMSPFAAIVVPGGLILNFVLIRLRKTKTLNVDVWNYWHILASASILYFMLKASGVNEIIAFSVGFIFAMLLVILDVLVADRIAPYWQEYFGLEGTTCSTISHIVTIIPFVLISNKLLSKIPGINKIKISLPKINEKLGAFGDPTLIGFMIGVLMAVITFQSPAIIIQTGVGVCACIVLMPRMVSIMMEGLTPISKAASSYMRNNMGEDEELLVGMDVSLGVGDEAVITCTLLLIPITIALAFIIPGNSYFPVGIISSINCIAAITVMMSDGDLFRSLLVGTVFMALAMCIMNFMAPVATTFVTELGVFEVVEGTQVTAYSMVNSVNIILGILGKILGVF